MHHQEDRLVCLQRRSRHMHENFLDLTKPLMKKVFSIFLSHFLNSLEELFMLSYSACFKLSNDQILNNWRISSKVICKRKDCTLIVNRLYLTSLLLTAKSYQENVYLSFRQTVKEWKIIGFKKIKTDIPFQKQVSFIKSCFFSTMKNKIGF